MARLKKMAYGIVSSYLLLAFNVVYSIVSVPVALGYLPTEQFGVWAVVMQIAGYLSLFDFGVNGTLARFLIDYKDQSNRNDYGSLIITGLSIQLIQAVAGILIGFAVLAFLPAWLSLEVSQWASFSELMRWQIVISMAGLPAGIFGLILTAHQRMDLLNYGMCAGLLAGFVSLLAGFHAHLGVYSLLLANGLGLLVLTLFTALACFHLSLFPSRGNWGRVDFSLFPGIAAYGADLFFLGLGTMLINSSQTILISKMLGLNAAAIWSITTKPFSLACQLVWRVVGNSMPAFGEMQVRREFDRLSDRYFNFFLATNLFGVVAAILFALNNEPFLAIWTHGRIHWPTSNNWLLAGWMILLNQVSCNSNFLTALKSIRELKYVYLAEGILFLCLSLFFIPRWGISGMLISSIVATACSTFVFGIWWVQKIDYLKWQHDIMAWQWPILKLIAALVPIAVLLNYEFGHENPLLRMVIVNGLFLPAAALFILKFCLSEAARKELLSRFRRVS